MVTHEDKTLYLIRHGQTDWNKIKRLQGRTDIPLNKLGKAQAARHGDVLAGLGLDFSTFHFVSSPLIRCRQTMEIIRAELGLPERGYDLEPALLELNYGDWEGKSWDELRRENPQIIKKHFEDPWHTVIPGGEMHEAMQRRVVSWYKSLPDKVIAVTHSGPSRMVRGYVSGLTIKEIPVLPSPQDQFLEVRPDGYRWV